ncbi:hypothetical protein [Streptomyces rameus]|uniref:Orn/Lys/Arg family decarboxylase n=1 Tax=Streptomyces rameus TaxID=68261 RepID=UPI003CD0ABA7
MPAERAVGREAAETLSPYPPGVPVVAPGEVITEEIDRSGPRTRVTGPFRTAPAGVCA